MKFVWAHQRTPIANLVGWRDKPVALSIVQARLVGLTQQLETLSPLEHLLSHLLQVSSDKSNKFQSKEHCLYKAVLFLWELIFISLYKVIKYFINQLK